MENVVSGTENVEAFLSPIHGNGLCATKAFKRGDILFYEVPWLFLQSTPNKQDALVCANCACFVGSLGTQMGLLERTLGRQELLNDNFQYQGDKQLTPIVHCSDHCGEVYCSEQCRDNHHQRGHALLCTGLITEEEAASHPLIQFKQHAVSTNEIFLMVGQIFASALSAIDRHPVEEQSAVLEYHLAPFESFIRELWWDVARHPSSEDLSSASLGGQALQQARQQMEKSDAEAQEVLRGLLMGMVGDSYALLSELFHLGERALTDRLSAEYVARTIGMFEQNNVGVRLENPLLAYVQGLTEQSPELGHVLAAVERIVATFEDDEDEGECDMEAWEEGEEEQEQQDMEDMEDMDRPAVDMADDDEEEEQQQGGGVFCAPCLTDKAAQLAALRDILDEYADDPSLFPHLDGTSFYTSICLMNHSCAPNVLVDYVVAPGQGKVGGLFEGSVQEFRGSLRKGLCAQVRALKDIAAGEELCQSYIDINLDVQGRQDSLVDYGIECKCSRCQAEQQ